MFLVCTLGPAQQLPGRRGGWRRLDAPGHSHPRRFPSPHGKWNWNDNPDERSSATLVLECFRHMTQNHIFWLLIFFHGNIRISYSTRFFLNGGIRKSKLVGRSQLLVTSRDPEGPKTINLKRCWWTTNKLWSKLAVCLLTKIHWFRLQKAIPVLLLCLSSSPGWSSYFHSTHIVAMNIITMTPRFIVTFAVQDGHFPAVCFLQYPFDICLKSRAFSLHLLYMRKYPMFDITKKTHKHLEWHSHLPELQKRQIWVLANYLNLKKFPIHRQT